MKMTTVAFAMALLFGLVVGATDASAHAHLRIVSPSVGLKTLAHGTYTVVSMQVSARGWRIVVAATGIDPADGGPVRAREGRGA
jgi:hypothetical protein